MKAFFNNREIATPVCGLVRNDTVFWEIALGACAHAMTFESLEVLYGT